MNSLILLTVLAASIPVLIAVDLVRNYQHDRAIWLPVIGSSVLVCGGVIAVGWLGYLLGAAHSLICQ